MKKIPTLFKRDFDDKLTKYETLVDDMRGDKE